MTHPDTRPFPQLASAERFAQAKLPPKEFACDNPQGVIQQLLGRHCAGIANRPSGKAMYAYLRTAPPNRRHKDHMDWAAYSLLGCCSPPDLMELIAFCQIPAPKLAAHVRALGITSKPVIQCLNQFAPQ